MSYEPPDEYLLGHFVSSESGWATKTPCSSRPVTITRRAVLNASGTDPVISATGHGSPMRFVLRDESTRQTVPVAYTGSVPDAFKTSRRVIVTGRLEHGVFVAQPDSLLTKYPSKYSSGGS